MDRRSLFYLSKLYVDQMNSGMKFEWLCPVIAINILDFQYLPYDEYHNRYRMKNIGNNDELTDVFDINFIELTFTTSTSNFSNREYNTLTVYKYDVADVICSPALKIVIGGI